MTTKDAYNNLNKHFREKEHLVAVSALLEWDQETYMPPKAIDARSEQCGLLARLIHERAIDPRVDEWLSTCESSDMVKPKTSVEAVNIRELRRNYDRSIKLPASFVEEESTLASKSQQVWTEARKKSEFSLFEPYLDKIVKLCRRKAELLGTDTEPLDALIDEFEPGAKAEDIEKTFTALRKELVELVGKIKSSPKQPSNELIKRPYDIEKQKIFGEMVAIALGYDFNEGRLDEVTHPFCTSIGYGDTRICTRYYLEDLAEALTGITHETGHALYDMGLNQKEFGFPMGDAVSLGIHESQSRMWENQVGRSKEFWVYFYPQLQRIYRETLSDVSIDKFYESFNVVQPSYIRVEADEVTYNLHIMLRFELERALISGELNAADIPNEWNKRFKDYLGIEVDKDSNGCLQDVHWSLGIIGYFCTYTLGNLYSAQFYNKALNDIPDLTTSFSKGNFKQLLDWLRKNIHSQGQRYRANDLCREVTGENLSHEPLISYLYERYGEIYDIKR